MSWFSKIKEFLDGIKVYLLCVSGIIAALVGYADDVLTLTQMLAAIWAALMGIAGRAAIKKSGPVK